MPSLDIKKQIYLLSTNRKLEITNIFALIVGGVLIKLLLYNHGPANSTIWGYGLSIVGVFLVIIISIAFSDDKDRTSQNQNIETILSKLITLGLPPILLIILLIWAVILALNNFSKLNNSVLPNEYYLYTFISSITIIIQIIALYMYFNNIRIKLFKTTPTSPQREELNSNINDIGVLNYILSVINIVILGMMQIVLDYFTTDG